MKRILAVVIVGVLGMTGFANYIHSNIIAAELPFMSVSVATVFSPMPCCFNAALFETSVYDNYYWALGGLGYGVKNDNASIAGGLGFIGEEIGGFVFASFYDEYLTAQGQIMFGFSCYGCVDTWNIHVYLALHNPCTVFLEVKDTQICDFHFAYFDINAACCGNLILFPVVGYDNLNGDLNFYAGCRFDLPELQLLGKLYLNPCLPYACSFGFGLTVNYQF